MGKRDYSHKEPKKQKKAAKKLPPLTIQSPPAKVEVIKRGKKTKEEDT